MVTSMGDRFAVQYTEEPAGNNGNLMSESEVYEAERITSKAAKNLNEYKDAFTQHYLKQVNESNEDDQVSLYLNDAIRSFEINNGHGVIKKHFRSIEEIENSYKSYHISNLTSVSSSIYKTNYLIHLTIKGHCTYRNQKYLMNIDFLQHEINDDVDGSSFLIIFESITLNLDMHSSFSSTQESKPSFNFSNRKSQQFPNRAAPRTIVQNNHSSVIGHSNGHHQMPISKPTSTSDNFNHNQITDHTSMDNQSMSQNHITSDVEEQIEQISVRSQPQRHHKVEEKNFAGSRINNIKNSVPLITHTEPVKNEERFDRKAISKYSGSLNSTSMVNPTFYDDLMKPKQHSEAQNATDGEQKMPSANEKYGNKRSNFRDNQRSNDRRAPRQSNTREGRDSSNFRNSRQTGPRDFQNRTSETIPDELYITNFDENCTAEDMKAVFQKFGQVENVAFKTSQRNSRYAHVKLSSEAEAQEALKEDQILECNGSKLSIKLRFANPPKNNRYNNGRRTPNQNSPRKNQAQNASNAADNADPW